MSIASIIKKLLLEQRLGKIGSDQYGPETLAVKNAIRKLAYRYRTPYVLGVLIAAITAKRMGISGTSVVEFGVARGEGLNELASISQVIQSTFGIKIDVYGFDWGASGLRETIDFRDHPEMWKPGTYCMESPNEMVENFRKRNVSLVIGDIHNTIKCLDKAPLPIGFVIVDVDYYNSTVPIMEWLLQTPSTNLLPAVPLYLDDTDSLFALSEYTGQKLAINEFNQRVEFRKIDKKSEKYRLYAVNCFDHTLRNTINPIRLDINHRNLIQLLDPKQF